MQVSFAIRGAEAVVAMATAAGELELNVMEPVIVKHLLGSLRDLEGAATIFATRCVAGLRWNLPAVEAHLKGSLAGAVEEAVERGYESAAASGNRESGSSPQPGSAPPNHRQDTHEAIPSRDGRAGRR